MTGAQMDPAPAPKAGSDEASKVWVSQRKNMVQLGDEALNEEEEFDEEMIERKRSWQSCATFIL